MHDCVASCARRARFPASRPSFSLDECSRPERFRIGSASRYNHGFAAETNLAHLAAMPMLRSRPVMVFTACVWLLWSWMTSTLPAQRSFGELLRQWRTQRRLSQLELALQAEVSARHLSFVETGRSQPSRDMVLHLGEQLDVPLRERNQLLLAAGYAPGVPASTALDSAALAAVRAAVRQVLTATSPTRRVVVDRALESGGRQHAASALFTDGLAAELLDAARQRAARQPSPRRHGATHREPRRVAGAPARPPRRQMALTADPASRALYDELRATPATSPSRR